jgi:hypothetical protein
VVPLQDADPEEEDIADLIEWFVSRDLKRRLEYVPRAAVAVEVKLRAAARDSYCSQ